jgi:hypothetical protein
MRPETIPALIEAGRGCSEGWEGLSVQYWQEPHSGREHTRFNPATVGPNEVAGTIEQ